MFEQTFVQSQAQTRKPWTIAVSLSLQFIGVAILLLIPLLRPETLGLSQPQQPRLIRTWIDQPPIPAQQVNRHASTVSPGAAPRPVFVLPSVHTNVSRYVEAPSADPELSTWAGPPAAGAFGFPSGERTALPPRIEAKPAVSPTNTKTITSGPIKVSEGVQGAKLVFGPHPVYPPLAKMARSEGIVKMEAIIGADGNIRNLRVVSGPPLLVDAAVEAVRQWRYQPTLLNGVAVEVLTEIDVNFTLTR